MAATINKFFTLNQMQASCKKEPSMGECWELKVTCKMKSVVRSRVAAFIRKIDGFYVVTLTSQKFKNFMAALASLVEIYVGTLRKLIMSMACPVGSRTADFEPIVSNCVHQFLNPCPIPQNF